MKSLRRESTSCDFVVFLHTFVGEAVRNLFNNVKIIRDVMRKTEHIFKHTLQHFSDLDSSSKQLDSSFICEVRKREREREGISSGKSEREKERDTVEMF